MEALKEGFEDVFMMGVFGFSYKEEKEKMDVLLCSARAIDCPRTRKLFSESP